VASRPVTVYSLYFALWSARGARPSSSLLIRSWSSSLKALLASAFLCGPGPAFPWRRLFLAHLATGGFLLSHTAVSASSPFPSRYPCGTGEPVPFGTRAVIHHAAWIFNELSACGLRGVFADCRSLCFQPPTQVACLVASVAPGCTMPCRSFLTLVRDRASSLGFYLAGESAPGRGTSATAASSGPAGPQPCRLLLSSALVLSECVRRLFFKGVGWARPNVGRVFATVNAPAFHRHSRCTRASSSIPRGRRGTSVLAAATHLCLGVRRWLLGWLPFAARCDPMGTFNGA